MSQTLAPYNNSMRLGQGFNSYTQQICLDRAVLPLTKYAAEPSPRAVEAGEGSGGNGDLTPADYQPQPQGNGPPAPLQTMPWVKPQIVTYSSRFVDKISDVTDAMNISGSLSIKTATIGGKANGSYIDSDKFKSSDINFHLQVKVTNQIHEPPEYCIFNKISKVKKEQFPEVYGDCFLSGWEEGGELNAVLSVKVHDKSKIFEIKAGLEAEMSTPTISGKIQADFGMEKKNLSKSTETTISVNWSGGGSIKDPTVDWSIESLKKAAAAFPDLVAVTPQRTYAILTKYTSLADFHMKKDDFSPLDYESAGIYTSALLDHYMDYKAMWKQISHATYELKGNRATIELGRPGEETAALATIKALPAAEVDAKSFELKQASGALGIQSAAKQQANAQALVVREDNCVHEKHEEEELQQIQFPVFSPTFAGLIHSRKVCRFEMAKIVNEVDLVAKNPKLATDTRRDSFFLNPLVFEQLLPIVRSLSPESAKMRVRDPSAAVLLGYVAPSQDSDAMPPVYLLSGPLDKQDLRLQNSVQRCSWKAEDYLMHGCAGLVGEKTVHSSATLVNDLETIDATFRPQKVLVWSKDQTVRGIRMNYAKGAQKTHGSCEGPPSHQWDLAADGSEFIVEVVVREERRPTETVVTSIAFVTSSCNVFDTAEPQGDKSESASSTPAADTPSTSPASSTTGPQTKVTTFLRPEGAQWSLRGFFSFSVNPTTEYGCGTPCTIGVVWAKDTFVPVPTAPLSVPICKSFLALGKKLQDNVKRFKTLKNFASFPLHFSLGATAAATSRGVANGAAVVDDISESFNALDKIDIDWVIKSIAFASDGGKLTGLKVTYTNGQEVVHGDFSREVWKCEVVSPLIIAKLTAGRTEEGGPGFLDAVEFIRADEASKKGEQAAWPLDISMLRYLGEGDARVTVDVSQVVERAPSLGGNARWTVRGFYGETRRGVISRLGVVWGRG